MTKGDQAVPEPAQRRPGRRRVPPSRPSAKAMLAGRGPAQAEEQAARTPPSPPPSGCGSPRQLRDQHVGPAARSDTTMFCSSLVWLSRSARSAEGEGGVLAACQPHPLFQSEGIPFAERGGRPERRVPASAAARSGDLTGFRIRGTSRCHCRSAVRAGDRAAGSPHGRRRHGAKGWRVQREWPDAGRLGRSAVGTLRGGRCFCASPWGSSMQAIPATTELVSVGRCLATIPPESSSLGSTDARSVGAGAPAFAERVRCYSVGTSRGERLAHGDEARAGRLARAYFPASPSSTLMRMLRNQRSLPWSWSPT